MTEICSNLEAEPARLEVTEGVEVYLLERTWGFFRVVGT